MDRAIALGFFDGVHAGHAAVIKNTLKAAQENGLTPAVVTFDRRPADVISGISTPNITDFEAKKWLIQTLFGIEDVIRLPFDTQTAALSPEDFIENTLIKKLSARAVSVGEGFKFGKAGQGSAATLERYFKTCVSEKVVLDGAPVSSSRIRELLQNGRVAEANRLLLHPYILCGKVVHGAGRGKRHGFATANLEVGENLLRLANGVYATEITIEGKTYPSLSNFGVSPTFEGTPYRAETHIPGFFGELHGRQVILKVIDFMRAEIKFKGPQALTAQISKDISERAAFGGWEV